MPNGISTKAIAREDLIMVGGERIHCRLWMAIGNGGDVYKGTRGTEAQRHEDTRCADKHPRVGRNSAIAQGMPVCTEL